MQLNVSLGLLTVVLAATTVSGMSGKMAECKLTNALKGNIMIHHKGNTQDIHFMGKIMDLSPGKHGFHVHEVGQLTNQCKDAGGHFNPENKRHGSLTSRERHAGDLENIEANDNREVVLDITLKSANLNDFIGRSIVVHERIDDLGLGGAADSLTTGNAGARLDCCVIQWAGHHHHHSNNADPLSVSVAATVFGLLSLFF